MKDIQYLNLSALAYVDFNRNDKRHSVQSAKMERA